MQPLLVSVNEARRLLGGLGRTKFYEILNQRQLTAVKIGRRTLVRVDSIHRYLDSQQV